MNKYLLRYENNSVGIMKLSKDSIIENEIRKINVCHKEGYRCIEYKKLEDEYVLPSYEFRNAWICKDIKNGIEIDTDIIKEIK